MQNKLMFPFESFPSPFTYKQLRIAPSFEPAAHTTLTLLLRALLLLADGLASRNPFLKSCLGADVEHADVVLLLLLTSALPRLSVTAAVRSSPACRPAVPMMLVASCAACI